MFTDNSGINEYSKCIEYVRALLIVFQVNASLGYQDDGRPKQSIVANRAYYDDDKVVVNFSVVSDKTKKKHVLSVNVDKGDRNVYYYTVDGVEYDPFDCSFPFLK